VTAPDAGYTAAFLAKSAIPWLRKRYPDSVIIEEFVCGTAGAARIDLAVFTDTDIHGIEIKGDGDKPDRLVAQGTLYSTVCTEVHLLPSPNFLRERTGLSKWWKALPDWWGLVELNEDTGNLNIRKHAPKSPLLSPESLGNLLWAVELRDACKEARIKVKASWNRQRCIDALVESQTLPVIKRLVASRIKKRDWKTIREPWKSRAFMDDLMEQGME